MSKPERNYIVTVPFRGLDFLIVPATSAAEAKRKAEARTDDCEGLDWRATQRYKPTSAKLEDGSDD